MSTANQQMIDRLFKGVEAHIEKYKEVFLPDILDKLGADAVEHSKQTHEYQNRTGALEASHDYMVILPGQTKNFNVKTPGGSFDIPISAPDNEIHLILGAHQQYGFWVEVKNGFSVLINSWLRLRNEFKSHFSGRFRSRRVF